MPSKSDVTFEFHVNSEARKKYRFDDVFFSITGDVVFANLTASRQFAYLINRERDLENHPEQAVHASELHAMGLLDEILHFIIEKYREEKNPGLFDKMEQQLIKILGKSTLDSLLRKFVADFPTSEVYKKKISPEEYLEGKTGDLSNRHVALEELLLLWLDNINQAYDPIKELIDDTELSQSTSYTQVFNELDRFFRKEPAYGPENLPLLELLSLPARKYPKSISAQLEYIRSQWSGLIGSLLSKILSSMDFIKEERKIRFDAGIFGPGPTHVIEFGGEDIEPERFSPDLHWMPRVVLIAKSTYVWLDQLSKKYQQSIARLDQIPDEELDRLASQGFTGLWLIGLWERSRASQRIKQMRGNPEAVASAYSLLRYEIASDLGGEQAYQNLRDRAWRRGIRLASDMVPNHMGIDSDWVINHPDWFVQAPDPPFPGYRYTGDDLCDDDRVCIQIEDGYWNNSDAAVVFKRIDTYTGETRYIYHGNDGTSMPWNDTAQLNYLMPDVREAVIQTILHVARKFPIIRFDAAMTLAKKHYARLWFPQPGTGGDIPSRSEYALTREDFDKAFPIEFWREVVDRIQQEVPDTLLLAEAFWMMEGYFVRSLGMHRVYNSAFMNMLKNEENEKYRKSIKNVLEFNPQILKRYVNFMNNPDEDTAIAQFGKDDKYFGVCILMSTMPGLPMFGHGQIEGYQEKYGMEYRRAYWDEAVDQHLVQRHEREIFPLLKRRHLFSDVENFLLYDLYNGDGAVNENVFVYSNRLGDECALVIYNNKFEKAEGWVKTSSAYLDNGQLHRKNLAEGLLLNKNNQTFTIFKDYITGLEYIRSNIGLWEEGLYLAADAFKYHVFLDFRQVVRSDDRPYDRLMQHLNGAGVVSIEEAMAEFLIQPVIDAVEECINPGSLRWLATLVEDDKKLEVVSGEFKSKLTNLLRVVSGFDDFTIVDEKNIDTIQQQYVLSCEIPEVLSTNKRIQVKVKKLISDYMPGGKNPDLAFWRILITYHFLFALHENNEHETPDIFEKWKLSGVIKRNFTELGIEPYQAEKESLLLQCLLECCDSSIFDDKDPLGAGLEEMFDNVFVQRYIGLHSYQNTIYFKKEEFESLLFWYFIFTVLSVLKLDQLSATKRATLINNAGKRLIELKKNAEHSGYELQKFMLNLRS